MFPRDTGSAHSCIIRVIEIGRLKCRNGENKLKKKIIFIIVVRLSKGRQIVEKRRAQKFSPKKMQPKSVSFEQSRFENFLNVVPFSRPRNRRSRASRSGRYTGNRCYRRGNPVPS